MKDQNTPTNTLREQICSIFNVFPDELGYDLPGGIGLKKVEQLEALISQAVNKAEQNAKESSVKFVKNHNNNCKCGVKMTLGSF